MITVTQTSLPGVLTIKPDIHEDFRGQYVELYDKQTYNEKGILTDFIQDDMSVSRKHVLRGLHGDENTWKLVSCSYGSLYFVVVNYDESSEHFGKWLSFTLSDTNRMQVLVPPKHGNGHLVMSDTGIFHYKQSTRFEGTGAQFSIKFDDPRFNIRWPITDPILSERDAHFKKS